MASCEGRGAPPHDPRGEGSARVRRPADARRRRPDPVDHLAPNARVPSGRGGRADPRDGVHAFGDDGVEAGRGDGRPGAGLRAVPGRGDDRVPGPAPLPRARHPLLPRARGRARPPVPGQRVRDAGGRAGPRAPRRPARRVRAPGVRTQVLGDPHRTGRARARTAPRRDRPGRLHLHADRDPARGVDPAVAVRAPHRGRPRRGVARARTRRARPHRGGPVARRTDPPGMAADLEGLERALRARLQRPAPRSTRSRRARWSTRGSNASCRPGCR